MSMQLKRQSAAATIAQAGMVGKKLETSKGILNMSEHLYADMVASFTILEVIL